MAITANVTNGKLDKTNTTPTQNRKTSSAKASGSNLGYDDFLKLLSAEMQYQDPLEPTSNTDYVAQMATFSQLEATLSMKESMSSSYDQTTKSAALSLVGKEVIVTDEDSASGYYSGKVDYVTYKDGKIQLSINEKMYDYSSLYSVSTDEYYDAIVNSSTFSGLTTNLPVYLRKSVQVEVMNSEAVTYSEFTNALSNPVLFGIVNFAPLHGNIIVEMASGLGYAIVDRMLGGRGDSLDKTREFSEIELLIIERILVICINLLQEPWQNVLDISPHLERIETNSQYAQIISPSEVIAIITMNIKIGDVEGLMNICLPYITLESVIDKLNTRYWYSNIQNHDETNYRNAIESLIQKSQIPVKAVLGKSLISVKDFSTLVPGDVIRLDTNVDDELDIYVGNIKKFTALPGSSGDKYAVRITSVVREEQ